MGQGHRRLSERTDQTAQTQARARARHDDAFLPPAPSSFPVVAQHGTLVTGQLRPCTCPTQPTAPTNTAHRKLLRHKCGSPANQPVTHHDSGASGHDRDPNAQLPTAPRTGHPGARSSPAEHGAARWGARRPILQPPSFRPAVWKWVAPCFPSALKLLLLPPLLRAPANGCPVACVASFNCSPGVHANRSLAPGVRPRASSHTKYTPASYLQSRSVRKAHRAAPLCVASVQPFACAPEPINNYFPAVTHPHPAACPTSWPPLRCGRGRRRLSPQLPMLTRTS